MDTIIPLLIVCDDASVIVKDSLFDKVFCDVINGDVEKAEFSEAIDKIESFNPAKITKKQKDEFWLCLKEEIEEFRPKCVLVMGEAAMYLTCNTKNIDKRRGVIQTVLLTDSSVESIHVVPTYSQKDVNNTQRYLNYWAKDILKANNIANDRASSVSPTEMVWCDTFSKVKQAVKYVVETGMAVFDFETPEIDKDLATFKEGHNATTLSITFQAGSGYVIPLEHKDSPFDKEQVLKIMEFLRKYVFENPEIRKAAHNLNYDAHILRIYGIGLRGRLDDTMLMHHLYDETERHGLKGLVETFYPEYAGYDDDLKGFKWDDMPIKILAQYNATDTDMTYRLLVAFESWLLEDTKVYRVYRNLTMAAFKPLFEAETRGMDIDVDFLEQAIRDVKILLQRQKKRLRENKIVKRFEDSKSKKLQDEAIDDVQDKLDKRIQQSEALAEKNGKSYVVTKTEDNHRAKLRDLKAGVISVYTGINFGSSPQLTELLYDDPDGFQFTNLVGGTGKDIIKDLPDRTGFIDGLLSYRSLKKTLSTYLEGIHKRLDKNNRIHTSFNLHGTASGRLSSSNPNLQNMPNTSKLTDETLIHAVGLVKKSFCVPEGHTLFQFDYSQAELRIIASFSNEENMLAVYQDDGDIHAKTGSEMLDIELKDFDKSLPEHGAARQRAKAVNFGLIYDMSAEGFQEYAKNEYGLELTIEEARDIKHKFFLAYPRLLDYHDEYREKARKFGHVRTLYGRRRRTPNILSEDSYIASIDERAAINSPIQGTAGEFTIFAIALLYWRLDKRVVFVNTIHDSILFYVPDDMIEYAIDIIKDTMENLPNKQYFGKDLENVNMKVDAEASKLSWKDLQELDEAV